MATTSNSIHLHEDDRFESELFRRNSLDRDMFAVVQTVRPDHGCDVTIFFRTIEQLDSLISAATEAREMLRKGLEENND